MKKLALIRIISPILISLTVWAVPVKAQNLYAEMATSIAKQGLVEAEAIAKAIPNTLRQGLNIAKSGYEFDRSEYCFGSLQSVVNLGAVVSNSMPFSQVWTYEDSRGPIGQLRIMLNGQQIHVEVFCDGKTLKATELPWGDGSEARQEYKSTSVSSLLGIGLNLHMQGVFDQTELRPNAVNSDLNEVEGKLSDPCGDMSAHTSQIGGPFELVSETGATVTDVDIVTKPTLIYFGYTFCPDVCPLDTARNANAAYILEEQGLDVGTVFISIDPARDTVDIMRDFTDNFHEDMIGLTGSAEQVKTASQAYRTYYNAHSSKDEYYLVDHSTFTYLMFPETGLATFFRREASSEQVAEVTACLMKG